jgi:predicted enzyme related to lactoylglutathione lyase
MLNLGCTPSAHDSVSDAGDDTKTDSTKVNQPSTHESAVKIFYLEIVTPDIDAACNLYSKMYSVTFGDPNPSLGGARTADLDGGGMLGVRSPLRETEAPVVRPYVLVDDIKKAVAAAAEAGAEIAMEPMAIGDLGQFAIVIHGGIESGLWQH